jgi:hypothetical protein
LWSAYPDDHIGRNTGIANREGKGSLQRYGEKPAWPWAEDERDFILFGQKDAGGRGSRDFRGMKENIYYAAALLHGSQARLEALSDGKDAVRLEVVPNGVRFIVNNEWNCPNLAWGNYVKDPVLVKPPYSNQVRIRFSGRAETR